MSNILAPRGKRGDVSRIPPEILSEIFGHCLVDFASHDTRQLLSSVCRLWRALVLATPALWASLDITCDGDILHPPLPVIRTHLQRSRTHTLAFRICTRSSPFYSSDPSLLTALMILADERQRWRKVDITLFGMTQEILNLIVSGDAPLLQSIQCNDIAPQGHFPIPTRILRRCPHLEYFHWNSISSPLLLPVAVTQLTSLSLQTALSVSECITLLHLSPRLSSALFYNITPGFSTTPPLTHPTLRALTAGSEYFPGLLASLTLPALLELNLVTGIVKWDTELSTFLARGDLTLRHLSLTTQRARGHVFVLLRILALTPHLRSLELSGSASDSAPFTATLIRALHPSRPPKATLCPHLQRLRLSGLRSCPDGLCTAMLRARWGDQARANGVACLEGGYVNLVGGSHEQDREDMKKLCEEGMVMALYWRGFNGWAWWRVHGEFGLMTAFYDSNLEKNISHLGLLSLAFNIDYS